MVARLYRVSSAIHPRVGVTSSISMQRASNDPESRSTLLYLAEALPQSSPILHRPGRAAWRKAELHTLPRSQACAWPGRPWPRVAAKDRRRVPLAVDGRAPRAAHGGADFSACCAALASGPPPPPLA